MLYGGFIETTTLMLQRGTGLSALISSLLPCADYLTGSPLDRHTLNLHYSTLSPRHACRSPWL